MQFGNWENLSLLLLLPLFAALRYFRFRRQENMFRTLAQTAVLEEIYRNQQERSRHAYQQARRYFLALLFILIAALRPQWGFTWREGQKKGLDIVVAFDVSESMLAEDVTPNRLERAKREVYDLLEALRGDRIGLVAFAGYAFTEVPLTEDYATFRLFLQMLSKDIIPVPGTNVGKAIEKSLDVLQLKATKTSAQRERAIILITDGEDLEGNWLAASKQAKEHGVQIYVLGVGTAVGAPIPTEKGYKKDKNGSVVVTKLNEQILRDMAAQTGGTYVLSLATADDTALLYASGIRNNLNPQVYDQARLKKWNEYYQLPLSLAILLLFWPTLRRLGASVLARHRSPLVSLVAMALLFSSGFFTPAYAQDAETLGAEGKTAYERGDYETAANNYTQGRKQRTDDYRFSTGLGASYYRQGDFEKALNYFAEAANKSPDDKIKAQSLYNLGNTKVQLNLLEDAIKDYEESLKLVPQEQVVIDNLAYARRLLEQQKKQEQENKQSSSQDQSSAQSQSSSQSENQENSSDRSSSDNSSANSSTSEQEQNGSSASNEQQQSQADSSDQSSQSSEQSSEANRNGSADSTSSTSESSADDQSQSNSSSQDNQSSASTSAKTNEHEQGSSSSSQTSQPSAKERQDQAILDSVAENRALFNNYRQNKALKELESTDQQLPEKDW